MEESHRCKLCSRTFSNGRALGGHMRSHLATVPLPPKTNTPLTQLNHQLGEKTGSNSSSSYSEQEIRHQKVLALGYGLRENPKERLKRSDPEFLDAGSDSVVVQDRQSETEPLQSKPTRRRSKRNQRHTKQEFLSKSKKPKLFFSVVNNITESDSVTESIQVSSVVSDPSPQDEQVALCLMMLSRDVWKQRVKVKEDDDDDDDDEEYLVELTRRSRKCYECLACKKIFRSNSALSGHRATSKMCQENGGEEDDFEPKFHNENPKIFECPFCYKVFGSGQALGGHKRSHLLGSSNGASSNADHIRDQKGADCFIDLNLPAPIDDI
ncbi:hypothetical protein Ancab_015945 [Ancistrocladus abbreviatus]